MAFRHVTNGPNKPDAVNPAIASRLHSKHLWRGVTDRGGSPLLRTAATDR
jgi:hypothetical protein